jgi:2,3-dihydroxyphenylpropionate 1,2-dioxygenase
MPLKTICLSHSPFIGLVSPGAGIESDVRATLSILAKDVEDYKPDLIILIAPDHFNGFFYDMMPQFCVGAHAEAVGDYNTPAGPIATSEDLAVAFVEAMSRENFDVAISYKMQVDHAFAQPLTALTGSLQKYPVLPLFINAAAPPRPQWARTREFGAAVGRRQRKARSYCWFRRAVARSSGAGHQGCAGRGHPCPDRRRPQSGAGSTQNSTRTDVEGRRGLRGGKRQSAGSQR